MPFLLREGLDMLGIGGEPGGGRLGGVGATYKEGALGLEGEGPEEDAI